MIKLMDLIEKSFGESETFADEFLNVHPERATELFETGSFSMRTEAHNTPIVLQLIAYESGSAVPFIVELAQSGVYGNLGDVFIIEAIRHYAELVSNAPEAKSDKSLSIDPAMWQAIGKGFHRRIEKFIDQAQKGHVVSEAQDKKLQAVSTSH